MFDYRKLNNDDNLLTVFNHAPDAIKSLLVKTDDGRIVCKDDIDIVFSELYIEKNLCSIMDTVNTIGMFAIIHPSTGNFGVFMIPAMVDLNVTLMNKFVNQDVTYRVLSYKKYDTIMEQSEVIVNDKLSYYLYNNFVELARVPWYIHYDALLGMFDQEWHYVGKLLTDVPQVIDMLISSIARDSKNDAMLYRGVVKSKEDIFANPPKWIPMKNISMGPADTMNKILGAYYDDGLASAIAKPSDVTTDVEKIMRS